MNLAREINAQEFDHVFMIGVDAVHDGPVGLYGPESVEHDSEDDILIDGMPLKATSSKGWQALEGYTGQYGYQGAVMHPSEVIGGRLANDMLEMSAVYAAEGTPLAWVVVSVEDPADPEHPVGWAVLYRKVSL